MVHLITQSMLQYFQVLSVTETCATAPILQA